MIVLWWCTANNRLFELAVHNHLSLSLPLSFSSPSYFPSFSKQAKRKTKLGFADRDPVQDAGPTLALEAAFRTELELLRRGALRQDVEEIVSEQTKLACTTGFLKANLQLRLSLSTGITLSHGGWADYNAKMNVALPQTTEPNRKFCSVRGRSNRTFGWIFGKMRHYFSTLAPGRGPFPSKFPKSGLQNLPNIGNASAFPIIMRKKKFDFAPEAPASSTVGVNSRFSRFQFSAFWSNGLASSVFIFAPIFLRFFLFLSSMQWLQYFVTDFLISTGEKRYAPSKPTGWGKTAFLEVFLPYISTSRAKLKYL